MSDQAQGASGRVARPFHQRLKAAIATALFSAAIIHLELLLIRSTSVVLWHHFTPLVFSLALFGFGLAGIIFYVSKKKARYAHDYLFKITIVFLILLFLFFWIFAKIPFHSTYTVFVWGAFLALLVSLFCLGGIFVGHWLVTMRKVTSFFYGYHLIGSALGCLTYLISMSILSASQSIFVVALLALGANAILFLRKKTKFVASLLMMGCLAVAMIWADFLLPIRGPGGKRVFDVPQKEILHTAWSASSRVDVMPEGYGGVKNLTVLLDGGAATTYIPKVEGGIENQDVNAVRSGNPLIHQIKRNPRVLVIGAGGGIDVRDFLVNGAKKIIAVEMNYLITNLVKKKFSEFADGLYEHPKVEVVSEDARSYLARSSEDFDIIHLGLPVTNSSGASNFANLSENFLLTKEAIEEYFRHLKKSGILYLYHDERTALKFTMMASQILKAKGNDDLHQSVVVLMPGANSKEILTFRRVELLIKKSPFEPQELQKIRAYANRFGRTLRYFPRQSGQSGFRLFFSGKLDYVTLGYHTRLTTTVTDAQPYFNHMTDWGTIISAMIKRHLPLNRQWPYHLMSERIMITSVIVLGVIFIFSVLAAMPMLGLSKVSISGIFLFISSIVVGFGFMCVEMALLNWLRILWAHPEITAMLVLAFFLTGAGFGSLNRENYEKHITKINIYSAMGIALIISIFGLIFPKFIPWLNSQAVWLQLVFVGVALWCIGFLMGIPFAWILHQSVQMSERLASICWFINVLASSLGAVLAVMIAMDYGYAGVLWIGACLYLALFLIFLCYGKLHKT